MRNALLIPLYLIGLIAALLLGGCGPTSTTTLDDDQAAAEGNPASMARTTHQSVAYQGANPSQIRLGTGDNQASFATPGAGAVMRFDPASGNVYLWSPKDTEAASVTFTPQPAAGEPKFRIEGLKANISDVAQVRADQFGRAMDAIRGMTEAEARRRIRTMEAAGEITSDVADVIVNSVIPNL